MLPSAPSARLSRVGLTPLARCLAQCLFGCLLGALCGACPWEETPGREDGVVCEASWQCADGLVCACGSCRAASAPRPCEADSQPQSRCADVQPVCFRTCGDFTPATPAACVDGAWQCSDGVLPQGCPPDVCWGMPQPGQVCVGGRWECQFGSVAGLGCITPGACGADDAGALPAPGCAFAEGCVGSGEGCLSRWCERDREPAVCVRGRWACAQGVLESQCADACLGQQVPACLVACGDPTVVGLAQCSGGQLSCSAGVLRASCSPDQCWGERPVGSVGCQDGGWVCGDAGAGPGGGCLTPGACVGQGPAPGCYATACCTGPSQVATCEGGGWACAAGFSTRAQCEARPFCPGPADAGAPGDASVEVDGGAPGDAGPGADAATQQDAGGTPATDAGPTDGGATDGGVLDAGATGDAGPAPPQGGTPPPACGNDIFEPNQTQEQAGTPLPAGTYGTLPGNGLRLCDTDADWSTFRVDQVGLMRVEVTHTGGPVRLLVYGPGGQFLEEALPMAPVMDTTTLTLEVMVGTGLHDVVVAPDTPGPTADAEYSLLVVLP